jgi:lipopolysaccharide export LptBFGC system permease protein LptF
MTIVAMLGLFYISTFLDLSDKWFKGQTTLGQILAFLWWSTPQFMSYIIALAVLLASLVTIGLLTKNSELIVMRACGVSLYRTAAPMVVFALVASAVLFGMEERVLALANRRADQLKHLIRGGSPQTFDVLNRKWIVGRNGEVYHYQFYNPRSRELNGVSLFEFNPETHALVRRVYASRAAKAFEPFQQVSLPLESADYFVTEVPEPRRMTYPQLERYIHELRQSGYDVLEHEVELYRKVAFPFVTLVMTFLAVPFAVTTGRRGAMYGIGVGIVLALVYWTMISVFAAFGAGGIISPLLAAWAPNLLFGAAAVYLLLTVRT